MKSKVLAAGVFAVLLVPAAVSAAVFKAGNTPGVGAAEVVQNDLYMAGANVLVSGTVAGDVYAGGGTVSVAGTVGADAVVGGGTVIITGNVADDVRVVGGTVVLQGAVGGDALVGGGQVTLAGRVVGDVVAGGGVVRIEAPVGGSVRVGGGEVYINAPIAGNVEADADKITLGPEAMIQGSFTYRSPKAAVIEDGAVVAGAVSYEPRKARGDAKAAMAAFVTVAFMVKTLSLLVLALVLGLFFKRFSKAAVDAAVSAPWREAGRGLLVLIVLPVLSVILFITVVGIPFGILGIFALVSLCMLGWALAAIFMGSLIYHYFTKRGFEVSWKTILVGVLAYTLLALVPFVGWAVDLLFMLAAVGTLASIKWQTLKEWR